MNRKEPDHIHILVVDDEEDNRDLLQRVIKGAGYDCSISKNARDALKVLEENTVDVVITDIIMPGMHGIELTKIVKEKYDSDVIVMTAFPKGLKYEEVIEIGASDFIHKPVGTKELLVRLKRVLEERVILAERNRAEAELERNFKRLKKVMEETVNALSSAVEMRDPYTAGHQKRVTKLACAIAKEMGLSKEQIEGIRIAGLLHDIGKISSPTDILNKPSALSINEYNLIREHPQTGFDILNVIEFEQPIAQIVLQHHERMNGSGYPHGLSSTAIIQEARVLGVADVVESMASHRPYRPGLGKDRACEEISHKRGILYDPEVVDACLKLFTERGFTLE